LKKCNKRLLKQPHPNPPQQWGGNLKAPLPTVGERGWGEGSNTP